MWRNTAQYGSSRPLFGGQATLVFRFKTHTCFRFYRKEPLPPDAAVPREAGGQACAGEMGRDGGGDGEACEACGRALPEAARGRLARRPEDSPPPN